MEREPLLLLNNQEATSDNSSQDEPQVGSKRKVELEVGNLTPPAKKTKKEPDETNNTQSSSNNNNNTNPTGEKPRSGSGVDGDGEGEGAVEVTLVAYLRALKQKQISPSSKTANPSSTTNESQVGSETGLCETKESDKVSTEQSTTSVLNTSTSPQVAMVTSSSAVSASANTTPTNSTITSTTTTNSTPAKRTRRKSSPSSATAGPRKRQKKSSSDEGAESDNSRNGSLNSSGSGLSQRPNVNPLCKSEDSLPNEGSPKSILPPRSKTPEIAMTTSQSSQMYAGKSLMDYAPTSTPPTAPGNSKISINFDSLPDYFFDTATFPIQRLVTTSLPIEEQSNILVLVSFFVKSGQQGTTTTTSVLPFESPLSPMEASSSSPPPLSSTPPVPRPLTSSRAGSESPSPPSSEEKQVKMEIGKEEVLSSGHSVIPQIVGTGQTHTVIPTPVSIQQNVLPTPVSNVVSTITQGQPMMINSSNGTHVQVNSVTVSPPTVQHQLPVPTPIVVSAPTVQNPLPVPVPVQCNLPTQHQISQPTQTFYQSSSPLQGISGSIPIQSVQHPLQQFIPHQSTVTGVQSNQSITRPKSQHILAVHSVQSSINPQMCLPVQVNQATLQQLPPPIVTPTVSGTLNSSQHVQPIQQQHATSVQHSTTSTTLSQSSLQPPVQIIPNSVVPTSASSEKSVLSVSSTNSLKSSSSGLPMITQQNNQLTHIEIETRRLFYYDSLSFGKTLFEKLPSSKAFFMKVTVITNANSSLTEGTSRQITLLHDGLKDTPAQITLDVCFFPQKVVTVYMKNCKSKATISKRHKKGLLRNGSKWCRNTSQCEAKGQCSCQAYPQRSIKKGIRKLKRLLDRLPHAPDDVVRAAGQLYSKLADTADEQIQKLPNYNSFLCERVSRLELFMVLKEYTESEAATFEIRSTFATIWKLMSQLRPKAKVPSPTKNNSLW